MGCTLNNSIHCDLNALGYQHSDCSKKGSCTYSYIHCHFSVAYAETNSSGILPEKLNF